MLSYALNTIIRYYLKGRYKRIQRMYDHAPQLQNQIFDKLIAGGKETRFGVDHDFRSIKNLNDYKNAVPIRNYNEIKKYIFRILTGEKNVLWPEKIKWMAKSSGTTSESSKFIPVSPSFIKHNLRAGGWDASAILFKYLPDAQIFGKKHLIMGGSYDPYPKNKKILVGDVSAIMIDNLPEYSKCALSPNLDVCLIADFEEKLSKMSALSSEQDVFLFAGVPTWTMLLFEKILEQTGKKSMLEVWPNAKVYMHGGIGFDPYRSQFKKFFPSEEFLYIETYNASEGYIAMQDQLGRDDLLLNVDHDIYYEFMPLSAIGKEDGDTLDIHSIEKGATYALVISSTSGLWRYAIGDTVRITSLVPLRCKIVGRTSQFINAFGEELMITDVERALSICCERHQAKIQDFTVAPRYKIEDRTACHEWYVEFKNNPSDLQQFSLDLDLELQSINEDYKAKRYKDLAVQKLEIYNVPIGTFHNWLQSKGKLGGQNKVPRLHNTRKYIEELNSFLQ